MRYTQGPIRGMTVEQATEKARGMWSGASPAVREKYANREESLMTGSERRKAMAASVETPYDFKAGSRRARPGDLDGDGVMDFVQGPSTPGAATPEENQRAQEIAREAAGQYGESAQIMTVPNVVSTDKPANPGVVAPAASTQPNGGAPSRSTILAAPTVKKRPAAALGGVQVGMGPNAGRMNPLTGKPIGYVPVQGMERPSFSYDADLGAVPRASVVPEAPMTMQEYGKVKDSVDPNDVNALDPRTPEASAARGRMRAFEEEQNARAAAIARRERVGPSAAERNAQQRQATRKMERTIASSYGNTYRF